MSKSKKNILAFAAIIVVVATSAAFAEDPENKIGDRYPFLEQAYQPSSMNRSAARQVKPRKVSHKRVTRRQVTNTKQYTSEVPENKIGDRYPFLEPRTVSQRTPTRSATGRRELTTGSIRRRQAE